jgi:uncharacterized protein
MPQTVSQRNIDNIVNTLTKKHPIQKIVLFGSQARQDAQSQSDLDLFLIMDFEGNRRSLMVEMRDLFDNAQHGIDILISRPSEYEEDKLIPGTLARQVFLDGKVLYEAF